MVKNKYNFKKVLLHEVGHFLSHQILFENTGEYSPFEIKIKWDSTRNCYSGEHTHKNKLIKGHYPNINESRIQEFANILNMLYGCIFQAIQQNNFEEFSLCRNCIEGSDDNNNVSKVYKDYNHYFKEDRAEGIINNHLKKVLNLNISVILDELDINDFIIHQDESGNLFQYNYEFLNGHTVINKIKSVIKEDFIATYLELESLKKE